MATRIKSYRQDVGTVALFVTDCATCGVVYGFSTTLEKRRRDDGQHWFCPNGHHQVFRKTEAERLRDELAEAQRLREQAERQRDVARAGRTAARDQAQAAERSARAYRGHLTRMRNRIAQGICPVGSCRRNFRNVREHIATEHPEWAHDHPDALA